MIKKYMAALAAVFMLSLTACGTITPPQVAETTTTTEMIETTTVPIIMTMPLETSLVTENTKSELTDEEKKQIAENTFIAEFFDSAISFEDTTSLTDDVMKKCGFEHESEKNGIEKITLKSSNGNGSVDVMVIDLSEDNFGYDLEYILGTFGDYYYGVTVGNMAGIGTDDFATNYRMTNCVVSKGKYERTGSVQKSDGMANQFGYAETYAVLKDDKLTVVSGQFLSTDMMERQTFSSLMTALSGKVPY